MGGKLEIATVASDPSGSRNSGHDTPLSPGGTHGPGDVNGFLTHAELSNFSHTFTWIPDPGFAFVSMVITGQAPKGVSIGSNTISGKYEDEFKEAFIEWTEPVVDQFTSPVYVQGGSWDDVPATGSSMDNLVDFTPATPVDKQYVYTITVNWINNNPSTPVPGVDVFTFIDEIYMDFWMHSDNATGRAN